MTCHNEVEYRTVKGLCRTCQLAAAIRCSHWSPVFMILGQWVLVRCEVCDLVARFQMNLFDRFTTESARAALTHECEHQVNGEAALWLRG